MHAGIRLAVRIEREDALNAAGAARAHLRLYPDSRAEVLDMAGGAAAFTTPESPLTHLVGAGMYGPVTAADIDAVETFYRERGCPSVNIDVCPHSHESLAEVLAGRGYWIAEFNNVLARRIGPADQWPADTRVTRTHDLGLWSTTVMGGFFDRDEPGAEEVEVGEALFAMDGAASFVAHEGGTPAAGATVTIRSGTAYFISDSTLTQYRGRGLQRALIEARLAAAVNAGCDIAAVTTLAGTLSQRNYERCGFRVVYTKLNMQRDF